MKYALDEKNLYLNVNEKQDMQVNMSEAQIPYS